MKKVISNVCNVVRNNKKKAALLALCAVVFFSFLPILNFNSDGSNVTKDTDALVEEGSGAKREVVKATKEVDVKTSEKTLDPVTTDYIKKNINTDYSEANMMRLDRVLVVKNTLVESEGISENETIDSFFARDDAGDLFITTVPTQVALYNMDENSKYYVGYANTMSGDKTATIKDSIFAIMNNNGEVVNDKCYFDKDTGLAYVSKDLFGDKAGNVQVQFLQAVTQKTEDVSSEIQYSTSDDNDGVKVGDGTVDGFDFETSVKTEKGLRKSELTVSVNGLPTDSYDYDSNTGIVTISQSSTAVQSIHVDINEDSAIAKLANSLLNVTDVEAFSMGEMGCAGTVTVPDGVGVGWKSQVLLYKAYASDWGNATLPAYGFHSGEQTLVNTIYNGGSLDYNNLKPQNTAMYLGLWIQGGVDTITGVSHNSFWNWSGDGISGATQPDAWLRLQCTHVSNPDTGKGVEWKDEWVNVRVLDKSDTEIVVGFLTKRVNTQSGASITKFKIRNVTQVHNVNYDANGGSLNTVSSNPNNYALIDNGLYAIQSGLNANRYLHASGANNLGPEIVTYDGYGVGAEQTLWTFERYKDTPYYYIFNKKSGYGVELAGAPGSLTDTVCLSNQEVATNDHLWYLLDEGNGQYSIVNKATNKALDIMYAQDGNNVQIGSYTVEHSENQKFKPIKINSEEFPSRRKRTNVALYINSSVPVKKGYEFQYWSGEKSNGSLGSVITVNSSYIKRFRIAYVSPTRFEILAYAENTSSMKIPTWTSSGGQDDLTWHDMASGSWVRDGQTFNFGTQIDIGSHNYETSGYVTHFYAYNSSGGVLESISSDNMGCSYYGSIMLPEDNYMIDKSEDTTLYANWKAKEYKLIMNPNGGTLNGSTAVFTAPEPLIYDSGNHRTVSSKIPTREGYEFSGWYDENGTLVYDSSGKNVNDGTYWVDGLYKYDGDLKVYAHWKSESYTVKYNANGGEGDMADQIIQFGVSTNLNWNTFYRGGFNFVGWNTKKDGTGTSYQDHQKVKDITKNPTITLYAQWQVIDPTIETKIGYYFINTPLTIEQVIADNAKAEDILEGNISSKIKINSLKYSDGTVVSKPTSIDTSVEGEIEVEYTVSTDRGGTATQKNLVYIVADGSESVEGKSAFVYSRFISGIMLDDGVNAKDTLEANSIWRKNSEYSSKLAESLARDGDNYITERRVR